MSTAPNAVAATEIPRNISGGLTLLAQRLLPAKLHTAEDAAGKKNGFYFNAWVITKGMVLTGPDAMTAAAIADSFYQAVVADCQSALPQLVWVVAPKALTNRAEQNKPPATRLDAKAINDLASRKKASEEADARIKAQEAAKKRVIRLVEGFTPTRRGVLKYSLRDEMQRKWKEQIAKSGDFVALESAIQAEVEKTYQSLERPEQV